MGGDDSDMPLLDAGPTLPALIDNARAVERRHPMPGLRRTETEELITTECHALVKRDSNDSL
jgi:hypothetical protein